MQDACSRYGVDINRAGFAHCPFHKGDHSASLKIYPGGRGWYCFGCNSGGDVVDFVRRLFNLDFPGAIAKLNDDFRLGLDRDLTYAERTRIARDTSERKSESYRKDMLQKQFEKLQDEEARLDLEIIRHRPKSMNEEPDNEFLYALSHIEHVRDAVNHFWDGR